MSKYVGSRDFRDAPPTLIRKHVVFQIHEPPKMTYVSITTKRERQQQRCTMRAVKAMTRTSDTSFIEGDSFLAILKERAARESHSAFQQSKIATLRKSPAYIVWPERPPPEPPEKEEEEAENDSDDDKSDRHKPTLKEVQAIRNRYNWPANSCMKGGTGDDGDGDDDDDDDEPKIKRNHSNTSFWDYAVGNIRVDSMYNGAPRRDPYNSTWTRDQRRCFFTSGFVPHHQRLHDPGITMAKQLQEQKARMEENIERQTVKAKIS